MTARIISGTEIAQKIREELKEEIDLLKSRHGITPGLATVIVGDDPASQTYVSSKIKSCQALGIFSTNYPLHESTSEKELLYLVKTLNDDPTINGILVQVPLPKHINENKVLTAIHPDKDVDGFHPVNIGRMVIGEQGLLPCTPAGIQQMLMRSHVETNGAEVVIVGRSNIVGKPIANMLMQKAGGANATVTVCHSATRDIASHTRRADILISAIGKPRFITADMVKPGATVIDVGTNEIGKTPAGKRILCGDVDFDNVKTVAGAITPVPGGVGPMTIVILMANTVKAAKLAHGLQ
ncbi:bifunctional methylenetetrahydrofolate dehydrogenase/methenyltetrahydrofolate cyclohydrolase FolD [Dehalogenimonas etheniformans]|uniref:Bifunctional protein FolD n=1 Tax=Dehalogenimonas etheniformans TaxID=1536648 RepID=A0A2P5P9F4_9CHLR|nr:bifunctional methylenetetrahydrofolate dehydrogenase/methenyltetrahydrofolate cyclohydrolase FolD [Dehalogenimonas etheniformans]PPD58931.1 bifunctional methylenetetrahydrofolate dehydrogenase/methenyltetrahydrofolate cyclohydrolase FolD [Dehalogenimonas etheniformans]QNT76302.1 bifunctional methylenetetrahydrofolate dehydrogenase/methenyltetrahydrofolate cyclohydrolase FolD [Dehalogenimonas etheniformans]